MVVSVDYSLTSDAKWPTQLEDCVKVYNWVHDNAKSVGGDGKKTYTICESAGGALMLDMCRAILKDPSRKSSIQGVAAMVSITIHPGNVPEKHVLSMYKSYQKNVEDVPIIDQQSMNTTYHLRISRRRKP